MPIRRLTRADKVQVLTLDKDIFSVVDPEGGWREGDFNQFFNEENCYAFCDDEHPESVIGYIFASSKEDHTYISNLGTDPKTGKRGIGTALMGKVLIHEADNAKKNNRPFAVKLHVDNDNEHAIRFYQNLGFIEDGRDAHGIKMTLSKLPEKFKQNLPLAPRKALIIRNVAGMQFSDLKIALKGLEAHEDAPHEFNELIKLIGTDRKLEGVDLAQALILFKEEQVRNYLYKTINEKTGNHVIYHLNGVENGIPLVKNFNYITDKLTNLPANTDFDLIYLGGGHGDPQRGSSNLSKTQLKTITDILQSKTIQFSAVILGSCFSAAYLGLYQPLLKENGAMLANSLECGGNNNFLQVMEWLNTQRKEFFSPQHLRDSISISDKARRDIKEVLQGPDLIDEYKLLNDAYKQNILNLIPNLMEKELITLADELLNRELEEFILDCQVEIESLNKIKIKAVLESYHKLKEYFIIIANKKDEEIFYPTLINLLQLTPSSLVVANQKALTMYNFNFATEIPANSAEDFQENYATVNEQIRRAGVFAEVHELTSNYHDLVARKYFNDLFTQATGLSQQEKEEAERRAEQQRIERERQEREEQQRIEQEQQEREEAKRREELQRIENQRLEREEIACRAEQKIILELQDREEPQRSTQQQKQEAKDLLIEQEHKLNQQKFSIQLSLLADKTFDLYTRSEEDAHTAAVKLYNRLDKAGALYFSDKPTIKSYQTFQAKCNEHIKEARKELDKHRDWSEFLSNLALGMGTFGIGLLIKGAINIANNRAFFFVHQTESSKTLNKFAETINTPTVLSY